MLPEILESENYWIILCQKAKREKIEINGIKIEIQRDKILNFKDDEYIAIKKKTKDIHKCIAVLNADDKSYIHEPHLKLFKIFYQLIDEAEEITIDANENLSKFFVIITKYKGVQNESN